MHKIPKVLHKTTFPVLVTCQLLVSYRRNLRLFCAVSCSSGK
nr:MAG TPA: hypothetical protein [Caudoviricetes sp.]